MSRPVLKPEILLQAYAQGLFPMAEGRDDPTLYWVEPDIRGVIPILGFHVPRRLARTVRQDRFQVTVSREFDSVMRTCATPAAGRLTTWINSEILRAYGDLHRLGFAESIECWRDGRLVGGLYGVKMRGAFFGESMFSRDRDASKVALVHLVARLKAGGFVMLDAQFQTAHLSQFGTVELARAEYLRRLAEALGREGDFHSLPEGLSGAEILQSIT